MAIRFLSSETIDGALTVNSTVTLNKTNNVINIPSLVDNGKFLQVTQVGNETWEFKCESLSGSLDGVTIGTTPGKVAFDENGQIQSIQLLDVATAGGRLTGFSNRGYLSSIHLEQTATNTDGGYIRFLTAASGTTSGLERFKITETGAFSVGPSGTNYGTSGQVLTSQGNALPTWTTPTTGTITGSGTANKVTKFTGATAIGDGPITFATNDSSFTGHVGIGVTAHATASLNITNANQHIRLNNGSELGIISLDSDGKLDLWAHGDGETIDFRTGSGTGTVAMSVVGTNVGIGLTSPGAKLDVLQEARVSFANSNQYTLRITNTDGNPRILADGSAAHLIFGTTPSGSATATERMRIQNDGNVGIGTTSPSAKLFVKHDVASEWAGTFQNLSSNAYGLSIDCSSASAATFVLAAYSPSGTGMFLNGSGNVGIGTTSPNFKLDIVNAAASTATYQQFRNGTTGTASSDGTVMGIDADGDFLINNQEAKEIKLYTSDAQRFTITSAGDVGIGYSSPSYKLDVNGVTRTRGFLQESNIFEDVADTAYFTNATADQNVDIILGNISMWGYIEITITGTYSYQSTPGKLTKLYAVGLNSGGTIYENNSRIVDAIGPINGNIYLDDLRWDSTVSQYRIRVAHIVSTGNQYSIKINAFSHSTGALNLAGWSISGLYTQSTSGLLAQNASYLNYLGIGTENATVQLQVERNTNSNHPMLFLDTTGGGSGCVGLNSSAAIGPYIEGNTNIDGTVRGAYGGSRMLFNAGGFTFQFSDETSGTRTFDSLMTIQGSTGNVGIGTTAPTTALSVSDGASMYANSNYLVQIKRNATNGNDDTSKASILLANKSNAFQIAYGGATDRLRFINGGGTEQMTLLNGGNVGIGTTTPTSKLDISDAVNRVMNSSGEGQFEITGNGYTFGIAMGATTTALYHNSDLRNLSFGTNETERLTITGGGNVGINITNPGQKLSVVSDASGTSDVVRINHGSGSHTGTGLSIRSANTGKALYVDGTVGAGFAEITTAYNANPNIRTSGDVVAYASSDKRFKDNLEVIQNPIDKIHKLNGYTFDWNDKQDVYKGKDYGVVAQEVEKVMPELVDTRFDGYKAVKYEKLVPLLIESIKEQQKQIDRLEEQIKKMSSKN